MEMLVSVFRIVGKGISCRCVLTYFRWQNSPSYNIELLEVKVDRLIQEMERTFSDVEKV